MIMKLAKRKDGQSNKTYARSVIEYISRATITDKSVSGHSPVEKEKCVHFAIHGCTEGLDFRGQMREIGMIADTADSRATDVLRHYVLSWPASQKPSEEQAEETAKMFLEGLGHDTNTAMWCVGLHVNTDHHHIHVFVNRQNPDTGELVKEGNYWWIRAGLKTLAKIEHHFNWKPERHAIYKWDEATETAVKIRKSKGKDDRVSDRARRMELESGHKSQERILKELCVQIRDMIAAVPVEMRSWADAHRAFSAVGIEYERVPDKQGATVTIDGKTYRAASSIVDDFSLKSMEKLIGSSYRAPKKKEAEDMKKAMDEARKKLFAAPLPLPKRLLPAKSKAKYLQEWDRGRYKNRLQNEQFQMRARRNNLQNNQQEMAYGPR